jgi:hypothetical protein
MTCRLASRVLFAFVLAAAASAAQAQGTFPLRQLTMVVPLPAGGTADLLCRLAAEKAGAILGQQIVIENRRPTATRCYARRSSTTASRTWCSPSPASTPAAWSR